MHSMSIDILIEFSENYVGSYINEALRDLGKFMELSSPKCLFGYL